MKSPMAFRATYADWKLIKTRGVIQVVMEVPLADSDAAYDVLGGMPNPANETWFGIAPIKLGSDKPEAKRDWRDLQPAQQSGIRCNEPTFRAFIREKYNLWARNPEEAAVAVREICGVDSRVELGTNHAARVIWHQLDNEFLAWKAVEHT